MHRALTLTGRLPLPHLTRRRTLVVGALLLAALLVLAFTLAAVEQRERTGGATSIMDGRAVPPGVTGKSDLALPPVAGASAGAASPGAPGGAGDLPGLDASRPVIRTGTVDITVRSVSDAFEDVRRVAAQAGGIVAGSSYTAAAERGAAQLTLRVPGDRLDDVVSRLRGLAVEVKTISTSSRDVAEEMTDLDATLRNLRAVESRYISLLDRASTIGEVLQVQDRLNQVRLQIDRTDARRRLLESQVEMATLEVTLRQAGTPALAPGTGMLDRVRDAWAASLRAAREVATVALVAVVYSWWALALAGVGALLLRRRSYRAPASPPAA